VPHLLAAVAAALSSGCSGEAASGGGAEAGPLPAASQELAAGFRRALEQKAEAAQAAGQTVVPGGDGFLFFAPELRSLAVGPFWGEAAQAASRAPRTDARDPLPAILDFRDQLATRGVELLFVPVPAKAVVYPEHAAPELEGLAPGGSPPRLDLAHGEFLLVLTGQGIKTLDLLPLFLAHRRRGGPALYCRQDTHWSGHAVSLAAAAIASALGNPPWRREAQTRAGLGELVTEERPATLEGDLWRAFPAGAGPRPAPETLPLTLVEESLPTGRRPVAPWRESPVLLLGDSHALVFSVGGDLHATGAGLAEHLARELGFPVDRVAVRGSGATPARVDLLRRGDGLAGKQVVVWVLAAREYTEGQGWSKVPVVPPATTR
jgi:alginate O-acetyltransferase complex protein AlgJ